MLGEKQLRFLPIVDNLSNSVTDEESRFGRIDWRDKGTIQRVRPSLNFMADDVDTFDVLHATETSKQLVAQEKNAGNECNCDREDQVLHENCTRGLKPALSSRPPVP